MSDELTQAFYALTPDKILDAVEEALGGRRTTGYALSLNSLENRVYELALEDESRVVAKFYRPGRWSEAAIREEHLFMAELVEAEVPAVAPIATDGETLRRVAVDGEHVIFCALFEKVRGRPTEEPSEEAIAILGRLLARLHDVGAAHAATERGRLEPASYGRRSIESLVAADVIPMSVASSYERVAGQLVDRIEPIFAELAPRSADLRLHADCHHGNLLWDARGPFFLDFDDFTMGPPAQDLWLIAPGRDDESVERRTRLVEAYEEMRGFDRRTLRLLEPLRALRVLRYAAWVAARYEDPAFQRAFPDFHDEAFWRREVAILGELTAAVRAA